MPVTFDNSAVGAGTAAEYATWNHTNAGNLIKVGVTFGGAMTNLVVEYNNIAMTEETDGTGFDLRVFYLVNPPVGTYAVELTWTTSRSCKGVSVSFSGVNPGAPLGTPVEASGSSTAPTVDVSSDSKKLVVDFVAGAAKDGTWTEGASQTKIAENTAGGTTMGIVASIETGAATTTMSWTIPNTAWDTLAVAINPDSGGWVAIF